MVVLTFLVLAGVLIWIVAFTLKFALERRVIPDYPARTASLRQIVNYYESELAKQGMDVEIVVLDESGFDEHRDVRGIGGNGYIFLNVVEGAFDTEIEYGIWRKITIGGVGSKSRRGGQQRVGEGHPPK